ncbi:MAG: SCO family protein [Phycisphaerae bacterium]|jgi:protein SCO1/2
MTQRTLLRVLTYGIMLSTALMAHAQEKIEVGIEEHLGSVLDLDNYTFADEEGNPIALKELFDRPVVLTLVYFRCPGICTPLLQELSKNVNNCDLTPGEDYRLVTISFDPTETPDLARLKKANFVATVDKKEVSAEDWRWLTGDEPTIKRITEAVGFRYIKDKNKVDYVHAATVIFLSEEGKIVRYLNGVQFNPADLKMAVIDATQGRARSFMRRVQALCYAYDPTSRGYVLQLNRIILGMTALFVMGFGGFLLLRKSRRAERSGEHEGEAT